MGRPKVGITGGSGYIGSALARHLSKTFNVKVLDKEPLPKDIKNKVEYEQCDIREYNKVEQGVKDLNLVIHTAIIQIPLINEARRLGYEVNLLGTQNICEAVNKVSSIKGMILAGSWHVFGEKGLKGMISEDLGFRLDKVEERARLYALSKVAQEVIVRFYDEISEKIYGIIRMGTTLGEGMPEKTAAKIFITQGLTGEPITPYKHSMHRPMLYIDINDVCKAFELYAKKILNNGVWRKRDSLSHIVNICYPEPITILELTTLVRNAIIKHSGGRIEPKIEIVDTGQSSPFAPNDKKLITVNINKAASFLKLSNFNKPEEVIERIVGIACNQVK